MEAEAYRSPSAKPIWHRYPKQAPSRAAPPHSPEPARPDQGHPEGGIPLKDDRPGQHRRQQQMDTRLRPQGEGGGGQLDLTGLFGLLPKFVELSVYAFSGRHACFLLCIRPQRACPNLMCPIIFQFLEKMRRMV